MMMDSDFSSSTNDSTGNYVDGRKRVFQDDSSVKPYYDSPSEKLRSLLGNKLSASVDLKHFEVPLVPTNKGDGSGCESITLLADQPYTVGRSVPNCQFVFHDRRVSKQHCQILFDGSLRKLYILNGVLLVNDSARHVVHEFRNRVMFHGCEIEVSEGIRFEGSSNGVFVNGVKVRKGIALELSEGDKVLLACGNEYGSCNFQSRIGFVIEKIGFVERIIRDDVAPERILDFDTMTFSGHSQGLTPSGKRNKRLFALRTNDLHPDSVSFVSKYEHLVGRANFLLDRCRDILLSNDPVSCILKGASDAWLGCRDMRCNLANNFSGRNSGDTVILSVDSEVQPMQELPLRLDSSIDCQLEKNNTGSKQSSSALVYGSELKTLKTKSSHHDYLCQKCNVGVASEIIIADMNSNFNPVRKHDVPFAGDKKEKHGGIFHSSPGKNFCLNHCKFLSDGSSGHHNGTISLPELLCPVESISRMFIATFTSDARWFLAYCEIPFHLPVTIACHNSERCWSSRPDERMFMPYPDYPNLVVVYPPFPEIIAFGNNRKRQGIACHHPKLLVLQREDSIRVVITSANLVEKQWNSVTNTVWWQDFPCAGSADFASLFPKIYDGNTHVDSKCDFASQLAGFMASLLIDVPSQAHWIVELAQYDFSNATGHLVASVPGIHSYRTFVVPEPLQCTHFLGSVVASVVGLSHLFRSAADSNGAKLKMLAAFLGKSCKNANGRLEVVLRRNPNVSADVNAVSVLVSNPYGTYEGEHVQLGFLPRNVAKWVSPLWDVGFFRFSGYVCPQEALAAASGENSKKVQLILYVSEGNYFQEISKMMQSEHIVAFCSLISSIQRCYGLWRLREVLNQYKWPESSQSDIIYAASSIGSINLHFLAAFSAAAGKKSLKYFDSEESDPEWGYWNASEELKNPSIKIIFPTIETVRSACNGILPSRRILCFSERTWQRLKTLNILHDAIPHPLDRRGHPMHVKVIRRRFWSGKDSNPVGWVYCGSHNFSAAAWGREISNPSSTKADGPQKGVSLGPGLHICNYELGIVFTFPPTENSGSPNVKSTSLEDIVLPFVVPAPRYGSTDRPATMHAMREAMAELAEQERRKDAEEEMMEEIPEEEEELEATNYVAEEKEEEKAYAEILWSQVDSSQSC